MRASTARRAALPSSPMLRRLSTAARALPSADRLSFAREHLMAGLAPPTWGDLEIASAKGSWLTAADGATYLDFTCGIGVTNTGHCHPKIVRAIQAQAEALLHGQVSIGLHSPLVALVEELMAGVLPASHERVMVSTTGAEAVENAVRIAKASTGRQNIISFQGGYHGRSAATLALTRSKTAYGAGSFPHVAGCFSAPFPYETQSPGLGTDGALYQLDLVLKQQTPPADTAALIIEPVLGEGGYVPAPAAFLAGLRERCDAHGILLILDEVQCGVGRTGRMWAHEHSGVTPDILVMAKGIGSGLPLSAVSTTAAIAGRTLPGTLGGTYAGNAVACAAALATLDVLAEERLVENAAARGDQLLDGLRALQARHPDLIRDVRGVGLMIGLELDAPAGAAAALSRRCAAEQKLLLLPTSVFEVVRMIPPLTVSEEECDDALARLGAALAS